MNYPRFLSLLLVILTWHGAGSSATAAEPKKLLVVETTTGFRHGSIPTIEKMLTKLSAQTGEFTIDVLAQPPGKPDNPKNTATPEQRAAYQTAEKAWEVTLKTALEKLSPDSLKNYDGIVFASTTGDLPIPDQQGFLDWIKAGHAFIGIHSATDTFHHWPGYIDMIGGEFKGHGAQVPVDDINADPLNPANASLPKVWSITKEEIYQFKNYDPAKVHELLYMDKHPNDHTPGHYPVSWCKEYGTGRVFYTALGHRDDIIDPDLTIKFRENSPDISIAYQAHVLGGIEWALGLKPGSAGGASTMRPLLDAKLTAWELWMGVPHQSVKDLPPGTPTSPDGHEGIPLGLNNDPKHVFSIRTDSGEPVLHITGEIFGGLTTQETFSNYHFRTEFRWGQLKWEPKLTAPRDNGILFDCTGPHGAFWKVWKSCFEFQVEEKNMGDLYLLSGTSAQVPAVNGPKDWQYDPTGPLITVGHASGAVGGKVKHLAGDFEKPNGEWNVLELYTIGQTAVYVVNGHVDMVLRQTGKMTGSDKEVTPLSAGQIQIQSEGAECEYRRMAIEPIADYPADIKKIAAL